MLRAAKGGQGGVGRERVGRGQRVLGGSSRFDYVYCVFGFLLLLLLITIIIMINIIMSLSESVVVLFMRLLLCT